MQISTMAMIVVAYLQSYRLCNIFHIILPAVRAIYILHSCGLKIQATPDSVARLATNQLAHPN